MLKKKNPDSLIKTWSMKTLNRRAFLIYFLKHKNFRVLFWVQFLLSYLIFFTIFLFNMLVGGGGGVGLPPLTLKNTNTCLYKTQVNCKWWTFWRMIPFFFSTIASVLIDEKEFDFHSLHVHNTVIARCMTVMKWLCFMGFKNK